MSEKGRFDTVIQNRRARFEYAIEDEYTAGIVLTGTEVKSLRLGKANLEDAYCAAESGELFLYNLTIQEYDKGSYNNHDPKRKRKLLLKKAEIRKLGKATERDGYTIVPLKIFFNERNLIKVQIGVGKGKKTYDKRETLKTRDSQREIARSTGKYA
ncbi:MAG: SsrA-binding protein SmpB [Bacteroidia bacterium]|nr:SsrA-binding protein SmpB [Bacteroidia bacterium]